MELKCGERKQTNPWHVAELLISYFLEIAENLIEQNCNCQVPQEIHFCNETMFIFQVMETEIEEVIKIC
jgi:hypothetical protein